ncbi:MAG: hypothetical protein ACFFAY_07360 [Promethearchaeota archaeon]
MVYFEVLTIFGHRSLPVPNTYLRLKETSQRLAIVFPGRGYTSQAPLLYYTINTLLEKGLNVLSVDYSYSENREYQELGQDEKLKWLYDDVNAAYQTALNELDVSLEVFVGKSLGTLAIGHLLERYPDARKAKIVWHTPLIQMPSLEKQIQEYKPKSLFVIGSADPHYSHEILSKLIRATGGEALVVNGADHSMEVSGSVKESLQVIGDIINCVERFV